MAKFTAAQNAVTIHRTRPCTRCLAHYTKWNPNDVVQLCGESNSRWYEVWSRRQWANLKSAASSKCTHCIAVGQSCDRAGKHLANAARVLYAALLANPQNVTAIRNAQTQVKKGLQRIKNRSTMPADKRKDLDDLEEEEYLERKIAAAERMADATERLADAAENAARHRLRLCSAVEGAGLQLYSLNTAISQRLEGAEDRDNVALRQCMAIEEGVTALVEGDKGGDDNDGSDDNDGGVAP